MGGMHVIVKLYNCAYRTQLTTFHWDLKRRNAGYLTMCDACRSALADCPRKDQIDLWPRVLCTTAPERV